MPKFNIESLEILNDEFEYCEKLGNGKFGMVYRVVCKSTGIDVQLDTFLLKYLYFNHQGNLMLQNMLNVGMD